MNQENLKFSKKVKNSFKRFFGWVRIFPYGNKEREMKVIIQGKEVWIVGVPENIKKIKECLEKHQL
ncbi:MAG: hypothetical protein RL634_240 [Bacteroidota bacterium]|jgi:hypothetical protein